MDKNLSIADINQEDIWKRCLFGILLFILTYLAAKIAENDYRVHLTILPTRVNFLHPFIYIQKNAEPLWHYCTKILSWCFKVPVEFSGVIVSSICNLVLYEFIRNYYIRFTKQHAAFFAFVTLVVASFYIPWYNPNIYLGQWTANVWHNPTSLMVRPFAFLVVFKTIEILNTSFSFSEFNNKRSDLFQLLFLILFSALAKPSFIQCFFPAIFIFCVIKTLASKGQFLPNSVFLLICCIPTFIFLCFQFYVVFVLHKATTGGFGLKFLYGWKIYSPNPLFSLCLAIIFPLCVLGLKIINKSKFSNFYIFSWIMFFCAVIEKAFFVEIARPDHGNFEWVYILSLLFIFISSIIEYLQFSINNSKKKISVGYLICTITLFYHFFIGLIYVYRVIVFHVYD